MNMRKALLAAGLATALATPAALAHHSFAAEFTQDSAVIEGVVTEVWFRAPHIRYYVEVTGDDGTTEIWDTRGGSPSSLYRRGWTPTTVEVGDEIVIDGYLGRDGRKLMSIRTITFADGSELVGEAGAEDRYPDEGAD